MRQRNVDAARALLTGLRPMVSPDLRVTIDMVMSLLAFEAQSNGARRTSQWRAKKRHGDADVTSQVTPGDASGDVTVTQKPVTCDVTKPILEGKGGGAQASLGSELTDLTLVSLPPPSQPETARPDKLSTARARKAPSSVSVTWRAYATQYRERYGDEPTWNARVAGQLAHFVQRVPADEAPEIAAAYVRSQNARYVAAGHSVGCLLQDAEKLRTEARTGRQGTVKAARDVDGQAAKVDRYEALFAKARALDEAEAELAGRVVLNG